MLNFIPDNDTEIEAEVQRMKEIVVKRSTAICTNGSIKREKKGRKNSDD